MSDDERFLAVMKALSDPSRLQILRALRNGRLCSCQLLEYVDVSQPTLSHHMSVLLDAGLVRTITTGRWYDYEIDEEGLGFAEAFIARL